MMKIQIGSLSEGIHEYEFRAAAEDLDLGEMFPGGVEVRVVLEKTGNQIVLKGEIGTEGRFTCDRCAVDFILPLPASYRMYYVTEGNGFHGIDPSEMQVMPAGTGSVDIADDVRQTVMLSVPLKLLCSNGCRGLCPHCGRNLNSENCSCDALENDPRWEELKSFRDTN